MRNFDNSKFLLHGVSLLSVIFWGIVCSARQGPNDTLEGCLLAIMLILYLGMVAIIQAIEAKK